MTVWVRRLGCYLCGQPVTWNDETKVLSCGCCDTPAKFVNLRDFKPLKEVHRLQKVEA